MDKKNDQLFILSTSYCQYISDCHKTFLSVDIYMMKCNSAVLTSYLFQQWPACVYVPNWKNVLCLCVWRFANWKNVLQVSTAVRCVSHVCNSYDKVTLILTDSKVNLATLDLSDSSQHSGSTSGSKNVTNHTIFQSRKSELFDTKNLSSIVLSQNTLVS